MNKYIRRENRRVAYKVVKEAFNSPFLDALVKVIVDYREQKKYIKVDDDLKKEIENCLSFIIDNRDEEIDSWINQGYWDNDDEEDEDEDEDEDEEE